MADFFNIKARQQAAAQASSSKTPNTKPEYTRLQPWVEKYRPKSLAEVTAQTTTIQILSRTLQSSNLPHMLFYGPPGTGKTSTILALAKQLYGPELMRTRVLELNASDERGISIVRQKVKDFARQQLSGVPAHEVAVPDPSDPSKPVQMKRYRDAYPCPPFKIIILDEADSMTQDAQSALRRTMETYSRVTRFCLVCNYVTRIIDPLASRCSKFRFKSLDKGDAVARVRDIAQLEGVALGEGVAEGVVKVAEGDLRRAITFLQSGARLVGAVESGVGEKERGKGRDKGGRKKAVVVEDDEDDGGDAMDVDSVPAPAPSATATTTTTLTLPTILEIAGIIPPSTLTPLLSAFHPKSAPPQPIRFAEIQRLTEALVADGWSAAQTVSQLYEALMFDETVADVRKVRLAAVFSEVDRSLVDGADEWLSVLDLGVRVAGVLCR